MNSTVVSLALVSLGFAAWMWYLARRAAAGALRSGPGIRVAATKVCEHTWRAAQTAAAPRYTKLALVMLVVAVATIVLGAAGVEGTTVAIGWFIAAIGAQAVMLAGASRDAVTAAMAVRCEHQAAPKPTRASGGSASRPGGAPRATSRTGARRGRGKGGKRR